MNSAEFNEIFKKVQEEWKKYWINDSASQPKLIQKRFDFSANLRLANTTNDIKDFFTQRKEDFPTICNNWDYLKLSNIEHLVEEFKDEPHSSFWRLFGPGFNFPYSPTEDKRDPILDLSITEWREASDRTKKRLLWVYISIHLFVVAFLVWTLSLSGYQDLFLLIKIIFFGGLAFFLNFPISYFAYILRKKVAYRFFIDLNQFNKRLFFFLHVISVFLIISAFFLIVIPPPPQYSSILNCILGTIFLTMAIGFEWFFGKPRETFLCITLELISFFKHFKDQNIVRVSFLFRSWVTIWIRELKKYGITISKKIKVELVNSFYMILFKDPNSLRQYYINSLDIKKDTATETTINTCISELLENEERTAYFHLLTQFNTLFKVLKVTYKIENGGGLQNFSAHIESLQKIIKILFGIVITFLAVIGFLLKIIII